jgi:hypothetical protein
VRIGAAHSRVGLRSTSASLRLYRLILIICIIWLCDVPLIDVVPSLLSAEEKDEAESASFHHLKNDLNGGKMTKEPRSLFKLGQIYSSLLFLSSFHVALVTRYLVN